MNRKIVMSTMSIMTSLALLAGTTFAAFAGSANATGNTFSTGNANLEISSDNSTFSPSIANFFTGTNIFPGYNQVFTFYLENSSTSNIPLNISATFTNVTGDTVLQNDLSTQFSCKNTTTNVTTTASAFSVTSMNGGSVNLGSLNQGEKATCTLTVTLPSTVTNTDANKNVGFDAVFNADQPSS